MLVRQIRRLPQPDQWSCAPDVRRRERGRTALYAARAVFPSASIRRASTQRK